MKTQKFQVVGAVLFCLFLVLGSVVRNGFAKPPRRLPSAEKTIEQTDTFMQKKLLLSQEVLTGLVLADFDTIEKAAEKMEALSQHAQWQIVRNDPVYNHFTIEFQRIAKQLSINARQKNLDGAAYANDHLIATCIACHKHIRDE